MYLYGVVCVANCPSGYFRHNLSTSFPICDKCDPTCLTCIVSASQCLSCSLGYMLDTVRSTCVQQCTNPQTFLSSDNKCYPCSTQCYSCYDSTATSCLSCKIPFVLLVNKCVIACPSGSYASPTNICLACNLALCTTCSILRDNCTSCYSGQVLQTIAGVGMCVNQCVDGYYLDIVSSICLGCDASCLTCNGPAASNCLSCKGNNVLFIGSPSSQCVSICPTNTTVVIDSWTQIKACQPCPTNCLSCSQVSNSANLACQSCTTGTYLFNGVCVLTCPSGTYPNPPICSPCNSIIGCNSCIINTTRQVQCTQCNYPYIMVTTSFACVLSCPTGTVLDLQGNCSPVPACSTSQWNGNCLSNCPTGTYSTLLSNNTIICQACLSPCAQCSSSTSCNICLDGFYLLTTSPQYNTKIGQCLLVCPVGYYAQNTSCLPCPSSCLSCLLTSSGVVTCSSCSNGLLINGICVSTCPVGYFGSTSSGICLPCASACLTCSSTSTCTQCKNSLYSIPNCNDNSCLGSTYRLNSTTCAPCNTICLTCFGSSDL